MSIRKLIVSFIVLVFPINTAFAQQSLDRLWTATSAAESNRLRGMANAAQFDEDLEAKARYVPDEYKLFELDERVLTRLSGKAVDERTARTNEAAVNESTISLPMPDGTFGKFQLIESPVMSPALQEKFPNIRAYRGQGLDDRRMSMRLDISPRGDTLVVRALVRGPNGTIIVDPFGEGSQHMSFFKNRNGRQGRPLHRCLQEPNAEKAGHFSARRRGLRSRIQSGAQLRTYRLAVACTGEYTDFHGGTVADAMAAINTTINRVNEVYERDVSIRFELVDDNHDLIFTDPDSDPFSNNNPNRLLAGC